MAVAEKAPRAVAQSSSGRRVRMENERPTSGECRLTRARALCSQGLKSERMPALNWVLESIVSDVVVGGIMCKGALNIAKLFRDV